MRGLVLAIGALVIVAACGRVPGGQVTAGDYKLYEAASTSSSQQLSVIDSRSHSVELKMPMGTPSSDWTHLYTVNGASLVDLDPRTGTVLHRMYLPGYYQLPPATISGIPGGLSSNGRWLVLESFDTKSGSLPNASHFVAVDTTYVVQPQRIDLNGYFQFDAVSNDGMRIFLIQYVSSAEYYVRQLDVGSRQLNPTVIFDKKDGGAAMAGLRLSGVASLDGHWLYSVYVRQDKSAFIHALNLDGNLIAFCLDLPGSGPSSSSDAFHWSLAMNADGTHVYAANGATGVIADIGIDNGFPAIQRIAHVAAAPASSGLAQDAQAKELGSNAAALSPDGRALVIGGKTGLVWIDTVSLKAGARQLSDWTVWSVAMSPDGTTVYAVNDAGMIAELPISGSHAPTTFGGAAGQPLALIRVEGVPG